MSLSIRARLAILLLFTLVVFSGALAVLQRSQEKSIELLFGEQVNETASILGQLIQLNERGFRAHADDYSMWDDMVGYVRKPSPSWAEINVHEGIGKFSVDIAWMLDAQLRTLYVTRVDQGVPLAAPPVQIERLRARLTESWFRHFFASTPEGILEIWTAPIQPSEDYARSTPPVGYYVIGRFWREKVLKELSGIADGRADLIGEASGLNLPSSRPGKGIIEVRRPLADLEGSPVATLRFRTNYPIVESVRSSARQTLWFMAGATLAVVLIAYIFLSGWVARPLQRIQAALHAEDSTLLGALPERHDELGRLAGLMVDFFAQRERLVTEVSERGKAEQEIALKNEFIRQIIDTDPNPIYVSDSRGKLVLANKGAMALFDGDSETLLGREVAELLAPLGCADSFRRDSALAVESSVPQETEERLILPDWSVRRYQTIRCPLRRALSETQVLTISVDVTERVRQREELVKAKEAAETAGRAKSQFLANISHELRSPMHGILSYARFGLREWGTAERPELRDYFQNISECGGSLLELLNDLLDLARLESGRMKFDFDMVDLDEVLDLVLVECDSLVQERGIQPVVRTGGDLPRVRADRMRILQVVRNLLSNAVKFTPAGKSIELATESDDRRVRVTVRDDGVGIPEDELELIFDKFVQSSKHTSNAGGTGLGLAICREIVEAHGGRIWAENRAEGGANIIFELLRGDLSVAPSAENRSEIGEEVV